MYYGAGTYEAFARPEKPEGVDKKYAYIIGTGLAGLSAAFYLVRDGRMKGEHIHLLEKLDLAGGSCDGRKDITKDLVEWICTFEVDSILNKNSNVEKWEDKFLLIFKIMEEEKIFVKNIYHSVSVEVLRNNLYRLVYPIIYSGIIEKPKGKNLREEDKKFITDFYKYAFVSIVLDWINKGMIENPEIIVSKVSNLITGTINHACMAVNK